ncbi:MAG: YqaJ viral recombinase family protein [Planctomycetota bacterium]
MKVTTAANPADRTTFIGASDTAAVLGMSPWRSPGDVYLEKSGRLEPRDTGNVATTRGNLLEPAVLAWAEAELGTPITNRQRFVTCPDHPHIAATLDGITGDALVEVKTSAKPSEWGDAGTDEIPDHYKLQVQHQLRVAGAQLAYVPVLLAASGIGFDFRMYRVERDDELAEYVVAEAARFWREHVQADVAPDNFEPSLDVAKRMRREPGKTVEMPDLAVAAYLQAQRRVKSANADLDRIKAELLVALDDGEAADTPAGHRVTYMEQTRKSLDAKAIERDHPEPAARYRRQSAYRVLRVKAGKDIGDE